MTDTSSDSVDEEWVVLPTEPYVYEMPDKQDDIVFLDRYRGWYGNSFGKLFMTRDGGDSWELLQDQRGSFVRSLAFIDENVGVIGMLGRDSYRFVTDVQPLYRTTDGGRTWAPIAAISGSTPVGICAIDVQHQTRILSGRAHKRTIMRAAGRVNGPAHLATSTDGGESWTSRDMSDQTAMLLDVRFLNDRIGFLAGATNGDIARSFAIILRTDDGGETWREVYRGTRLHETTWKIDFPSDRVGYVTLQNYDPDDAVSAVNRIVKTIDGGHTFEEVVVSVDDQVQHLGIGFVDERRGWVGALAYGFRTLDGGASWERANVGPNVNKFRFIRDSEGVRVFAIGAEIRRLDLPVSSG